VSTSSLRKAGEGDFTRGGVGMSKSIKVRVGMLRELLKVRDEVLGGRYSMSQVVELWPRSPCCNALLIQDPVTGAIVCSKCRKAYGVVEHE